MTVRRRPGPAGLGVLTIGGTVFSCAIGRSGISAAKREGDGATPLAAMALLGGYVRPGVALRSRLPLRRTRRSLGWCDAPGDRNYNRPVPLPYSASHERMWRDDGLYDVCLVLGWNVSPRVRGRGSAIFMHLARPGYPPTEGCVAVSRRTMMRLLPLLSRGAMVRVVG